MVLESIRFKTPVVRVRDKDANSQFYQQTLGFKLVSEENALAIFSSYANPETSFMIEESPAHRTRAPKGLTKHRQTIIQASSADEIEALLGNGACIKQLFKGEKGYAFEAESPQGFSYLLHAETDLTSLVPVEGRSFPSRPEVKGLSDYQITELALNVPDVALAKTFYDKLSLPLSLTFYAAEGDDLQAPAEEVWDLEYLEFQVPDAFDLRALEKHLTAQGHAVYLDKKARLLVLSDNSQIEIWLRK